MKLSKETFANGLKIDSTYYVKGLEYFGDTLKIFHADGVVEKMPDNTVKYYYYIKNYRNDVIFYFRDANGDGIISDTEREEHHYYPYGMKIEGVWMKVNEINKYGYSDREYDDYMGWADHNDRFYGSDVGRFWQVDKLSTDMPNWNSYQMAFGNLNNYSDPNGLSPDDFIIWYTDEEGNQQSFRFNGQNEADAPENEFVQDVITAFNYNACNGAGCAGQNAANDGNVDIDIIKTSGRSFSNPTTNGEFHRQTVYWNTEYGLQVENGDILSPATVLEHEVDHSYDAFTNPEHFVNTRTSRTKHIKINYDNFEEYRVITGNETNTARANSEISKTKKQSRYSHNSNKITPVKVATVTSNKRIN